MTRERAIEVLKAWDLNWSDEFTANEFEQAFAMAISALFNKGDLISRQAVEDVIYDYSRSHAVDYAQIMERIDKIPSVENKGEWFAITQPWADTQIFRCTCCGRHIEVPQYEVSTLTIRYPFCHCGADMRGE